MTEADSTPPADGWRDRLTAARTGLGRRLASVRSLRMSDLEREKLTQRLHKAVDAALAVPDDLPARLEAEMRVLREDAAEVDVVALAWRRTRVRARRAAAAGVVTTLPAMVPGVGTALAALGLVADWRFVAEQQRDLVLEIAALLGVHLDEPAEHVRTLFLASTGAAFGAARAGDAASRVVAKQLARGGAGRVVPGLGAAVSGSLNYLSTLAVGRAAIVRFAREAGLEVRGITPEAVHPGLPRLRQAVVGAIGTAALGDGATPIFTSAQREVLVNLAPAEREELLDLAVVGALADLDLNSEESEVLAGIAGELGFSPEELQTAIEDAADGAEAHHGQVLRLVAGAGRSARGTAQRIWRRRRLLRRSSESGPGGEEEA